MNHIHSSIEMACFLNKLTIVNDYCPVIFLDRSLSLLSSLLFFEFSYQGRRLIFKYTGAN